MAALKWQLKSDEQSERIVGGGFLEWHGKRGTHTSLLLYKNGIDQCHTMRLDDANARPKMPSMSTWSCKWSYMSSHDKIF